MNELYVKDKGFVLKRIASKNEDAYIIFYGKECGKIVTLAKGAQKATSKLAPLLNCGNYIDCEFLITKSGYKLKSCSPLEDFQERFLSYEALLTSVYICDLVDKGVEIGLPQDDIFHLLYFCLLLMNDKNFSELRLFFSWRFLTLIGYGSDTVEYITELFHQYWHVSKLNISQQSIVDEIACFLMCFAYENKTFLVNKLSQNAYTVFWEIIKQNYQKQAQIHLKSQKILEETIGH